MIGRFRYTYTCDLSNSVNDYFCPQILGNIKLDQLQPAWQAFEREGKGSFRHERKARAGARAPRASLGFRFELKYFPQHVNNDITCTCTQISGKAWGIEPTLTNYCKFLLFNRYKLMGGELEVKRQIFFHLLNFHLLTFNRSVSTGTG